MSEQPTPSRATPKAPITQADIEDLIKRVRALEIAAPQDLGGAGGRDKGKAKIYVAKPEFFSGDSEKFEDWKREVEVYLTAADLDFENNTQ